MSVDGDGVPVDIVGPGRKRLGDRDDELTLVGWIGRGIASLDDTPAVILDRQPRELRDHIFGKGQ